MFKSWARNSLMKISYFFTEKSFVRGQYLWKAGDPSVEIYIIIEGEFRIYNERNIKGK